MKEITFVRHGKSSWKYDVSDSKRPLKKRGIEDVRLVSEAFSKYDFEPDLIFTSPAKRAHDTCKNFIRNASFSEDKVQIIDQLYDFGGQGVINFIRSLDNNLTKIMVFGHNHAFTSIANTYGTKYIDNVPTSGLFKIDFEIDNWSDLDQGKTVLTIFPRDLK